MKEFALILSPTTQGPFQNCTPVPVGGKEQLKPRPKRSSTATFPDKLQRVILLEWPYNVPHFSYDKAAMSDRGTDDESDDNEHGPTSDNDEKRVPGARKREDPLPLTVSQDAWDGVCLNRGGEEAAASGGSGHAASLSISPVRARVPP
jgi:hypothetical protein